jgi:hypothetical protein
MPHYFLNPMERFIEYEWSIVRETQSSLEIKANIQEGHKVLVDIHYTTPTIALCTIVFIGERQQFTKMVRHYILNDITHIILRHNRNYWAVDYNLVFTDSLEEGNFCITQQQQKFYNPVEDLTSYE